MNYLDEVKVIKDRDEYKKNNIYVGDIGTIWMPEIRDNSFYIQFDNNSEEDWYKYCVVKITDLELVKDNKTPDHILLEDIPKNNPNWWCKVENGFILNLKGEKKNKIPYDYNS